MIRPEPWRRETRSEETRDSVVMPVALVSSRRARGGVRERKRVLVSRGENMASVGFAGLGLVGFVIGGVAL